MEQALTDLRSRFARHRYRHANPPADQHHAWLGADLARFVKKRAT